MLRDLVWWQTGIGVALVALMLVWGFHRFIRPIPLIERAAPALLAIWAFLLAVLLLKRADSPDDTDTDTAGGDDELELERRDRFRLEPDDDDETTTDDRIEELEQRRELLDAGDQVDARRAGRAGDPRDELEQFRRDARDDGILDE